MNKTALNKPIPKTNWNQKKKLKQTNKINLADTKPRTITLVKKKRPTKMTITTENLIEYDTSQVKDNEEQPNNMQTNTKRQVNRHLPNNQNITERKIKE